MGFIVVDDQGRVVASRSDKTRLEPLEGRTNASLSYLDSVVVDPGVYEVRLAAVDAQGRHGSVVRDVNAWKMAGEEFTYADLVVNHAATASAGLRPDVEPHVDADGVAAYMELYAASETTFKDISVSFEIADDDSCHSKGGPAFDRVMGLGYCLELCGEQDEAAVDLGASDGLSVWLLSLRPGFTIPGGCH